MTGDSQTVNGRPSIEHCSIAPGTSDANVNVALFVSLRRSGPVRIIASGDTWMPAAIANRPKSFGSPQTRPASVLFVTVMSVHSLPLCSSRRAGASVNCVLSYGRQRRSGSP